MLKIVLLVIVVAIVAVLGFAATRPDSFVVKRTAVINAPPEKLVGLVQDFHQWGAWSPWEKMDPGMSRTYEGPAAGVGSAYAWSGNDKVGTGRMEIQKVVPAREVVFKLDFLKPFKASNTAEFVMTPTDAGTDLSWAMFGPSPLISKLMGVFMDMDKIVGKDFEAGLAALKREAEQQGIR
jgi:uncharacterized protein YndB with AHSA1/START domain